VSEADADHHRYRALLRDADDEPKRLALIRLLIDEGARDKLAAHHRRSRSESPFEPPPLLPPVPLQREVPEKPVESATQWPGEVDIAGPADDASLDSAGLAAPPGTSELAPPALASEPPAPTPCHDEVTELSPQSVVAPLGTASGSPVALIAAEPSRPDDLADRVATLVSDHAASADAGPVAAMTSPSGTPPAASDVEIASRIQAALAELTRVHRQQDDSHRHPTTTRIIRSLRKSRPRWRNRKATVRYRTSPFGRSWRGASDLRPGARPQLVCLVPI